MGMHSDCHATVLNDLLKLGRRLLNHIDRRKRVAGAKVWAVALYTKILSSGHSVSLLVKDGATSDAKMLLRSMLDGLLDMMYILEDPLKEDMLVELFLHEHKEDWHEKLRDLAAFRRTTVEELARELPVAGQIVSEQRDARERRRSALTKARCARAGLPTRWKDIDWRTKRQAVEGWERLPELTHFGIRLLGDAAAHSRPIALEKHVAQQEDGGVHFRLKPASDHYYSRKRVALEACVCLAPAVDKMIDLYYLQPWFQKPLQRIAERLDRLKPKRRRKHFLTH